MEATQHGYVRRDDFLLRQMVGFAGLLLPVTVRLGGWLLEGIRSTDTISAYYWTGMRDLFVSTLVVVGVMLAFYRTAELRDRIGGLVAGLAAIGIALFPMDPVYAPAIAQAHPGMQDAACNCYVNHGILGYHYMFVATFFAACFYLVFFRFSALTPAHPTHRKVLRNRIYRLCGGVMLICFIVIAYFAIARQGASIFFPESLAVFSFAFAWLVKGRLILGERAAQGLQGDPEAEGGILQD